MNLKHIKRLLQDNLSKLDVIVLFFLRMLENSQQNGNMPQRVIAKKLGVSSCNRSISKLRKLNYINVERNIYNRPAIYKVKFFNLDEIKYKPKKKKPIKKKKLNTNDLCGIWKANYFGKYGISYSQITNKERGQIKRMLDEYGVEKMLKVIKFTIEEDELIQGYPSISAMYGYRRSLVPNALKGRLTNKAVKSRQYRGDDWNEEQGF